MIQQYTWPTSWSNLEPQLIKVNTTMKGFVSSFCYFHWFYQWMGSCISENGKLLTTPTKKKEIVLPFSIYLPISSVVGLSVGSWGGRPRLEGPLGDIPLGVWNWVTPLDTLLVGVWKRIADRTLWILPFDITYTAQDSGADLAKQVGTSGFLNFLHRENHRED